MTNQDKYKLKVLLSQLSGDFYTLKNIVEIHPTVETIHIQDDAIENALRDIEDRYKVVKSILDPHIQQKQITFRRKYI